MAYSCTFEDCDHGIFRSREAWAAHERQDHLRSWTCAFCRKEFDLQDQVISHMAIDHPFADGVLLKELVQAASPQIESVSMSQCPFCDGHEAWEDTSQTLLLSGWDTKEKLGTLVPVGVYQQHTSRHMEQLALLTESPAATDGHSGGDKGDETSQVATEQGLTNAPGLSLAPGLPLDQRPEGWTCSSCGFSNFQRRTICFRCSLPRDSTQTLYRQTRPTSWTPGAYSYPHSYQQQGFPPMPSAHTEKSRLVQDDNTYGSYMPTPSVGRVSQPAISARRASVMPGSFPGEAVAFGSPSESSSESTSEEEDYRRYKYQRHPQSLRKHRARNRAQQSLEDMKAMPLPLRQTPALGPILATPSNRNLGTYMYPVNQDTRQAPLTQHEQPTRGEPSPPSPQIVQQYIVEDAKGLKRYYDTREEAESKAARLNQQQRENEAETYQAKKGGSANLVTPLTSKNIQRAPMSDLQSESSRSTASSRLSASESTIEIRRGDSVYVIPADRTVEIMTKDGNTMTIGPCSPPQEKSYHGSTSRMGRNRDGVGYGGRRKDAIIEEDDGYENAL